MKVFSRTRLAMGPCLLALYVDVLGPARFTPSKLFSPDKDPHGGEGDGLPL